MSTLKITDLTVSKELDSKAMSDVYGGEALVVGYPSFSLFNDVVDLDVLSAFEIGTVSSNLSSVNAAQGNVNGNGLQNANQSTYVGQASWSETYGIGNTSVGRGFLL